MTEEQGREWVIEQLANFIDMTQSHNLSSSGGGVSYVTSQQGPKASRSKILEQLDTIETILDRYYPEWRERQDEWASKNYEFAAIRQAAIRCRSRLERQDEVERHLEADAPTIRIGNLHPWVWDAARPQWETGHHTEAVFVATLSINSRLQQKTGSKLSDSKLVTEAFSTKPPTDDMSRLRVPPDDGSDTAMSMQQGVMTFGVGCMKAIRNPLAHLEGEQRELSEHEALERLAALSLLARWTDQSDVVS